MAPRSSVVCNRYARPLGLIVENGFNRSLISSEMNSRRGAFRRLFLGSKGATVCESGAL
jgi:hypothetical protein